MKKTIFAVALLLSLALIASTRLARAQSSTPQDTLHQYISDLQKNPSDTALSDTALREKIIKLAREMNPPPAIPEEARRHYVKACTLFEDAKQPSDSADAAEEFRQALLVAPWWGEAYMKMGLALETAQRYDDAIASLKLFMVTKPQDDVLRKTQDEIYKVEAKAQKAVKDKELAAKKAAEEARAKTAEESRARTESVEGKWSPYIAGFVNQDFFWMWIRKQGNGEWTIDFPGNDKLYTYDIKQSGRSIAFTKMSRGADPDLNTDYYALSLSADGTQLVGTLRSISIGGNSPHWTTEETKWARQ